MRIQVRSKGKHRVLTVNAGISARVVLGRAEEAGLELPKDWQTQYLPEFRYGDHRRTIGHTIDATVRDGMIILALRRSPYFRYNWIKKRWEIKHNPFSLTRLGRKRRRGRKGRGMRDMLAAMAGELFSIPWKDRGRRGR